MEKKEKYIKLILNREIKTDGWGIRKDFLDLTEKLFELPNFPKEGACEFPRSTNKFLERFRVAMNLRHDLFNNGLHNHKKHFRSFFGFTFYNLDKISGKHIDEVMEPIFTNIIFNAAKEQKLI